MNRIWLPGDHDGHNASYYELSSQGNMIHITISTKRNQLYTRMTKMYYLKLFFVSRKHVKPLVLAAIAVVGSVGTYHFVPVSLVLSPNNITKVISGNNPWSYTSSSKFSLIPF
jgi:type II secretory pathway component HofQ